MRIARGRCANVDSMRMDQLLWSHETRFLVDLRPRIAACEALLAVADSIENVPVEGARIVVLSEFTRGVKTFRAMLHLAQIGYGQQAFAMAADVFDAAMSTLWAARHPEADRDQLGLHARFRDHLASQHQSWVPALAGPSSTLTPDELLVAERLFGLDGMHLWTGHPSLGALVEDIAGEEESDFFAGRLRFLSTVVVPHALSMRRASGHGSIANWSIAEDDRVALTNGPDTAYIMDALNLGGNSLIWMVEAALQAFGLDETDKFNAACGMLWRAWRDSDELRNLKDADPCPCDKPGTTWAECHKWTDEYASRPLATLQVPNAAPLVKSPRLDTQQPSPTGESPRRDLVLPPDAQAVTFTFSLPFPVGLVDTGQHRLVLPDRYADPVDIARYGETPWVLIRLWNSPSEVEIWPPRMSDALEHFYAERLPDLPIPRWGAREGYYEQWITLETPPGRLASEDPEDGGFAFHRALHALNTWLRACALAFSRPFVHPVTTRDIGFVMAIGYIDGVGTWEMHMPMMMHPDAFPPGVLDLADNDERIVGALTALASGQPFASSILWRHRAARALTYRADLPDAVINLQTAAETLLFDLWRTLLVDEGLPMASIQAALDAEPPFKSLFTSKLPELIGGSWTILSKKVAAGRYWSNLYLLRNRIVHGGYEPSRREADAAFEAFDGLNNFVNDRAWAMRRQRPRTALAKLGREGVEARARGRSKESAFVVQLMAEPSPFYWPIDIRS
jgi:hypothetical protein